MATEQLFVRPGSLRPWQHCRVAVLPGNPNHGRHIQVNMNGSGADASRRNVNGSCVGVILKKVNGSGANASRGNASGSCVNVILGKVNAPEIVGDRIG